MVGAEGSRELRGLLASAEVAGPVHRIDWRDPIAAYGRPAIDAIAPWLVQPTLAAFAIRVIERVGHDGEQEVATAVLRGARRSIDAHVRPDLDWAIQHLRALADPRVTRTRLAAGPTRSVRARRPLGAGKVAGVSRRTVPTRTSEPS